MGVEVYEKLRQHLDRLPLGAPKTAEGVEIEFLKRLFTEEEAELATQLIPMPEGLDSIAQRTGRDKGALSAKLEAMADKGLVFRVGEKGNRCYNIIPILPGIYEFQVDRIDAELAHIFDDYYMKALGNEVFGAKTPWMRVVPVEREIPQQMEVFPYEKVSEIIKAADVICVAECICRKERKLVGAGCDAPTDNCLVFSHWAHFDLENGSGRRITQEEALQIAKKAEEAG
ncbi:MAG: 4Fe-4S ferredoxin, partial [Candidatus Tectomicrobia bacterium]|nr:4Fe-4S ferredoxin [Candidatus Tectomicrobia bacterium]